MSSQSIKNGRWSSGEYAELFGLLNTPALSLLTNK